MSNYWNIYEKNQIAHTISSMFFALLLAVPSMAQEALTLKEALNRAVTQNPLMTEARLGVDASEEGIAGSQGKHWPKLSLNLDYNQRQDPVPYIPAFKSFIHPLTIMSAIPLALIGAVWSLLLSGHQQSTAAFMGVILLAGIVVKNSILLIDFIEVAKEQGATTIQALTDSVRVRTRPIIMTAFGTAVGMVPIALERAIGLEHLSPLAVVAIGGLMLSTFLTLLYVPIFYTIFEDLTGWVVHQATRIGLRDKQPAALDTPVKP